MLCCRPEEAREIGWGTQSCAQAQLQRQTACFFSTESWMVPNYTLAAKFIPHSVQATSSKVSWCSGHVWEWGLAAEPSGSVINRILTMQYAPSRPSRHKPEPVCYYHTAACVVRFPHSLKHFVFCQSGAHFASPWQGQVYFLLGLNIFGSQMRETVPREGFRFPQIIREGVCAHAVKVLRDCFSLIKEAETQTELSRTWGYAWSSFSGSSLCFSLSGWAGSFHILGAGSCYIHLGAEMYLVYRSPLFNPRAGPK